MQPQRLETTTLHHIRVFQLQGLAENKEVLHHTICFKCA